MEIRHVTTGLTGLLPTRMTHDSKATRRSHFVVVTNIHHGLWFITESNQKPPPCWSHPNEDLNTMDSSKIPPKIVLVNVSAKNDNNTNAFVISGKLILSSISGNLDRGSMCLKLRVEGKENETVQRVFASGIKKTFHVLFHGRNAL